MACRASRPAPQQREERAGMRAAAMGATSTSRVLLRRVRGAEAEGTRSPLLPGTSVLMAGTAATVVVEEVPARRVSNKILWAVKVVSVEAVVGSSVFVAAA